MRGKRSKQYRKLMQQFSLTFGFRPPYQVLVDAQMIQDSEGFKMDLLGGLERTLGDKIKPMITQCSIRHLYTLIDLPPSRKDTLIAAAKNMERRRCNHHILEQPLSTLECLSSVIDPGKSLTNKNHYVVASQDEDVRRLCRGVKGVPLVYVKRSVMVMEPMSDGSSFIRENVERSKFRSGLRGRPAGLLGKRKRGDESGNVDDGDSKNSKNTAGGDEKIANSNKGRGPKGPNPLAVKKPKRTTSGVQKGKDDADVSMKSPVDVEHGEAKAETPREAPFEVENGEIETESNRRAVDIVHGAVGETQNPQAKRKRKRKHKPRQLEDLKIAIHSDNEVGE